jgi:hypothetical protein
MADQKEIVAKMQAAYDEFTSHMRVLEQEGSELVKATLSEIDQSKISAALEKIKNL